MESPGSGGTTRKPTASKPAALPTPINVTGTASSTVRWARDTGRIAFLLRVRSCLHTRTVSVKKLTTKEAPLTISNDQAERLTIRELIENWAVWRDAGDWERFRTVWH